MHAVANGANNDNYREGLWFKSNFEKNNIFLFLINIFIIFYYFIVLM